MFTLFAQDPTDYPGIDGFLGTRGSLMLDVVFLAMFAVVPLMCASIYLVKYRRKYDLHKLLQVVLGSVLLIAVIAFEVDMQFLTEWEKRAEPSPCFETANKWSCSAGISLIIHLTFAVPTTLLWVFVIVQGLRHFPSPINPNIYSLKHVFWARLAAIGMLLTAVSGWTFYALAFVL